MYLSQTLTFTQPWPWVKRFSSVDENNNKNKELPRLWNRQTINSPQRLVHWIWMKIPRQEAEYAPTSRWYAWMFWDPSQEVWLKTGNIKKDQDEILTGVGSPNGANKSVMAETGLKRPICTCSLPTKKTFQTNSYLNHDVIRYVDFSFTAMVGCGSQ